MNVRNSIKLFGLLIVAMALVLGVALTQPGGGDGATGAGWSA